MNTSTSPHRGIVLAGGSGTGLHPTTLALSMQLLPVYDKPMVYDTLATLMLAGICDILLISTPLDTTRFQALPVDGHQWGVDICYCVQPSPDGLAQAFILGRKSIGGRTSLLVLGDNIFCGHDFQLLLHSAAMRTDGTMVCTCHVHDPQRYGVVEFDAAKYEMTIQKAPTAPNSDYAITGLYFYDSQVCDIAASLKPLARGELEITEFNARYLQQMHLEVEIMDRGYARLDTGTHDSLLEASQLIATPEMRQGQEAACPEEIAFHSVWITREQLETLAQSMLKNDYGKYLMQVAAIQVF